MPSIQQTGATLMVPAPLSAGGPPRKTATASRHADLTPIPSTVTLTALAGADLADTAAIQRSDPQWERTFLTGLQSGTARLELFGQVLAALRTAELAPGSQHYVELLQQSVDKSLGELAELKARVADAASSNDREIAQGRLVVSMISSNLHRVKLAAQLVRMNPELPIPKKFEILDTSIGNQIEHRRAVHMDRPDLQQLQVDLQGARGKSKSPTPCSACWPWQSEASRNRPSGPRSS